MALQNNSDVGSIYVPKIISGILTEVSLIHDFSQKISSLSFYLHLLEKEMKQIDAFKNELPYCMHLLKDGIEMLNEEKMQLMRKGKGKVMMPLESYSDLNTRVKSLGGLTEKKNWMSCCSTIQLWSTPIEYDNNIDIRNHNSFLSLKSRYSEEEECEAAEIYKLKRGGGGGGAFVPFKKTTIIKEEEKMDINVPVEELSLSINVDSSVKISSSSVAIRPHDLRRRRKLQRRCWLPELHKRFITALAYLGGPHLATPKQIRKLMKVDGLTNDEVKSHLQKYRLHLRKLPSTSSGVIDINSWLAQNEPSGSPQDHLQEVGSSSNKVDKDEH